MNITYTEDNKYKKKDCKYCKYKPHCEMFLWVNKNLSNFFDVKHCKKYEYEPEIYQFTCDDKGFEKSVKQLIRAYSKKPIQYYNGRK